MIPILAYIFIVPLFYKNWIGIIVAVGIAVAIIFGLFLRSVMTREIYEKILTLICILSLTSTSCAISERWLIPLFNKSYYTHRISAMFFYPNYFGTIIATVIIICAYKVLTEQGKKWFYYGIAGMNVISMYLCGSMFVWVEVFLGVAVLLVILKKHRLLAIWFFIAALAGFFIFVLKMDLIPRLSDAELTTRLRVKIWKLAIKQIARTPIFGHGLMSYLFVYKNYYLNNIIPHSHSIYLEMLLNFGVVGTILFLRYLVRYFMTVIKLCFKEKNTQITSLILAVTSATLVHGLIDVTILWIQTLPFLLIILAGVGAYEHTKGDLNENILD